VTHDDRQALVYSVFAAMRRLVPTRSAEELEQQLAALTVLINDHGDAGFEKGQATARERADAAEYQRGVIDGMMAVEARADRRDPLDVKDPQEWQSVQ
jgi:hypothetical protein